MPIKTILDMLANYPASLRRKHVYWTLSSIHTAGKAMRSTDNPGIVRVSFIVSLFIFEIIVLIHHRFAACSLCAIR